MLVFGYKEKSDLETKETMISALEALGLVYDRIDHGSPIGELVGNAIIELHREIELL